MPEERVRAHRLATCSDAVFAVIVTVMVLELNAPDDPSFSALLPLWPTALSYAALFVSVDVADNLFELEVFGGPSARHVPQRKRRIARRRSLAVLAIFATAMLVAVVRPRSSLFALRRRSTDR